MNIYLIGYRCTGKTSVSRWIGRHLEWPVLDADEELVREQGRTIADIVAAEGWSVFREMEKAVLKRLGELDHCVVATGGGVILDAENVAVMKKSGTVVLLRAGTETIYRRLVGDQTSVDSRPALTDKNQYDEIVSTLKTRTPLYESAMDFAVDTDDIPVEEVCRYILNRFTPDRKGTDKP